MLLVRPHINLCSVHAIVEIGSVSVLLAVHCRKHTQKIAFCRVSIETEIAISFVIINCMNRSSGRDTRNIIAFHTDFIERYSSLESHRYSIMSYIKNIHIYCILLLNLWKI